MDKARIGFVGVGSMGQCAHLRNYVTLPDCEVTAIAEIREELGQQVARRYGVQKVYRSHTEMLASEKLDGIVASQLFTRHGLLVPDLLKGGVPLFTEKPLAGSALRAFAPLARRRVAACRPLCGSPFVFGSGRPSLSARCRRRRGHAARPRPAPCR